MAGGSCPNVPVKDAKFLSSVAKMNYVSGEGDSNQQVIGAPETGYVIYCHGGTPSFSDVEPGTYAIHSIDAKSGKVETLVKKQKFDGGKTVLDTGDKAILWLERL